MDKIQKILIEAGRKDLAQEYYKKVLSSKVKKESAHRFNLFDLIFEKLGIEKIHGVSEKALIHAHPKLGILFNELQRELDKINWTQVKEVMN